jgi:hypothetical protein
VRGHDRPDADGFQHPGRRDRIVCLGTLRCGCKPNAAHIRRIVVWEKPVSAAIERIDQCVASTGVVRNVRSITAAT